jgi:hypothetical protein
MIVSTNQNGYQKEFEGLLGKTIAFFKKDPSNYKNRTSSEFEIDTKNAMDIEAKGSSFEGTLILKGGGTFPDIITDPEKYPFGVEVKTTKQDHWTTTGNSVLESTRVEGIERIYILFGKLVDPVDFLFRQYEECILAVAVTHSPRYMIDMTLKEGQTIFDKLKIPYDELRKKADPISSIKDYYRKNLRPGESLWWLESPIEPQATNLVIRMWSSLGGDDKEKLKIMGMALFPEIFSASNSYKYARFAAWLATKHAILNPSLRDPYSAGGQVPIKVNNQTYRMPKIIENLRRRVPEIIKYLTDPFNISDIEECWQRKVDQNTIIAEWIFLVKRNANNLLRRYNFPLEQMIKEKMAE